MLHSRFYPQRIREPRSEATARQRCKTYVQYQGR
nr:MAG TPA: hypothetical protein [Caudoviricetes sp.]